MNFQPKQSCTTPNVLAADPAIFTHYHPPTEYFAQSPQGMIMKFEYYWKFPFEIFWPNFTIITYYIAASNRSSRRRDHVLL
jgi:hypothetical protein